MLAKVILGTILVEGLEVAKNYITLLKEEYFFDVYDREVFRVITKKVNINENFDAPLIVNEIKLARPYKYIADLINEATAPSLLPSYIDKLRREYIKNKVMRLLQKKEDSLGEIAVMIEELEKDGSGIDTLEIKEIAKDIDKMANEGKGMDFLFEFPPLKKKLVGLDRGTLVVIGGYTGMAKSALCIQLADEFATDGYKVLFCSSEMTEQEIGRRIIGRRCQINSMSFRNVFLSELETKAIKNEIDKMDIPLWLSRVSSVSQVRSIVKRLEPHIVFVDHIHQMVGPGRSEYEMISNIIVELKNLAMDEDIAVIAVSQLHRKEKGSSTEPRLADFRSSGRIEENANVVILVHWPYAITGDEEKKNQIRLIIAKSRDGEIGRRKVFFLPEYYEFKDGEKQ